MSARSRGLMDIGGGGLWGALVIGLCVAVFVLPSMTDWPTVYAVALWPVLCGVNAIGLCVAHAYWPARTSMRLSCLLMLGLVVGAQLVWASHDACPRIWWWVGCLALGALWGVGVYLADRMDRNRVR